jgi:hypothetical protein
VVYTKGILMSNDATLTEKEIREDAAKREKIRLTYILLKNVEYMTLDYKNTIKHTGGLLTQSMTFAYNKALNDAFKLLTKEDKNEEPVQEQEGKVSDDSSPENR